MKGNFNYFGNVIIILLNLRYTNFMVTQAKLILLLILLIGQIACQPGGSVSDEYHNQRWYDEPQDKPGNTQGEDDGGYFGVIVIVLAFFGIVMCTSKNNKKAEIQRQTKIQKSISEWEGSNESAFTGSDEDMKKEMDKFENTRWLIKFNTENNSFVDDGPLKVLKTQKKGKFTYNFKVQIHDSIGRSQGNGVLLFSQQGPKLIFEKTYDRRESANQTASFDIILYKGRKHGQRYTGTWAFKGYEDNSQYSGKWDLLPQY